MATESVVLEFQAVIEACLTDKLKAGYDASAALSVDLARQVAAEIEARAVDYTDAEIAKLTDLIGDGVDLKPITDFMATLKDLLDGDETAEGFQVFQKLISDTADNKQTLVNHTTSISLIQSTLATFQAELTDHENRIAALEAMDHSQVDCEACHDDMLNIIKAANEAACTAASTAITAYAAAKGAATSVSFADELDPVSFVMTANVDGFGILNVASTLVSGRRADSMLFTLPDGSFEVFQIGADKQLVGGISTLLFDPTSDSTGTAQAVDGTGAPVGAAITVVITVDPTIPDEPDVVIDPITPVAPEPVVEEPILP